MSEPPRPPEPSPRTVRLGQPRYGCLPPLFLAMAMGGLVIHLWGWFLFSKEWRANHVFIEANCTVLNARIAETGEGENKRYGPEVEIRYTVDGRERTAWTFDATRPTTTDSTGMDAEIARFPIGSTQPCWYDPADPTQVIVVRGHSGATWSVVALGAMFTAVSLVNFFGFRSRARRAASGG